MKYSKTLVDMTTHLNSQISFLNNSIRSYDSGFEDEAQRIATIIRILLHDTNKSTSLFKHLDMKSQIFFLSTTGPYIPKNLLSYEGLLAMSSTGFYLPHCLSDSKIQGIFYSFENWWNEIIIDDKINVFSRKNIILNVADTDGGAHVDKDLNEDYANITKHKSLSGHMIINNEEKPFRNNPVYACIRQIAFELLYSIDFFQNMKTYTRKRDDTIIFIISYINDHIYIKTNEYENNPVFDDSRITKTEELKHYADKVIFKSGKTHERHVLLK